MQSARTVVHVISSHLTKGRRLTELFHSCGIDVIAFGSAAAYDATTTDDQTACLILEMNHLGISDLEVQRHLVETGAPPVIFITEQADPVSCVRAVKNGAIDVLFELINPNELLASVRLAFARYQQRRRERLERGSLLSRWKSLTPREMEVFHHTVAGLLNKQAAAELGIAENTYQVHRGRVMRKMQANSLADLVRMSIKLRPILKEITQARDSCQQTTPTNTFDMPLSEAATLHAGMSSQQANFAA
jgi:FixJ family two-component response regulator